MRIALAFNRLSCEVIIRIGILSILLSQSFQVFNSRHLNLFTIEFLEM